VTRLADIRVLVAEAEPLARQFLTELIEREPDLEVVGATGDCLEAIAQAIDLQPEVLLIDPSTQEVNALEAVRQLALREAAVRVLFLGEEASDEGVLSAFRAGVKGFLPKRHVVEYLAKAIRIVAGGETWIDRRMTTRLIDELESLSRRVAEVDRPDAALSQREREVLSRVGRGLTNAQIARELFLSERTVKVHVSRIFQKLAVPNRTQAALFAQRIGLVVEDAPNPQGINPPVAR
jgi:DNA-binding NarL/FixJ family response regulator